MGIPITSRIHEELHNEMPVELTVLVDRSRSSIEARTMETTQMSLGRREGVR